MHNLLTLFTGHPPVEDKKNEDISFEGALAVAFLGHFAEGLMSPSERRAWRRMMSS